MKTDPRKKYFSNCSLSREDVLGWRFFVCFSLCRPNKNKECANTLSLKTELPWRVNSLLAL